MTDRQDIDALLIGSLYGELSSTEEARLAAHLESHPADRTALANLQWARDAVRESRILQHQLEPPQSISALLLQEAHRRAPRPQEAQSWFQRFVRSFMLHPAVAAAAMLVVVIGIAGTMYMRQGDQFAKQTAEDEPALEVATPTTATPDPSAVAQEAQGSANAAGAPASTSDEYRVQLDDSKLAKNAETKLADGDKAGKREEQKPTETLGRAQDQRKVDELAFKEKRRDAQPPAKPARTATAKKSASKGYLEVTTPDRAPKDFGVTDPGKTTVAGRGADLGDTASSTRTTVGGAGTAPAAPAEPTPAPRVASQPPAPPPVPADKPDANTTWAKQQHAKVIAAVKRGDCGTAANLAVQIATRVPAYYTTNVESDIAIKSCKAYITQQREREAERVQRAKATQRRASEPTK